MGFRLDPACQDFSLLNLSPPIGQFWKLWACMSTLPSTALGWLKNYSFTQGAAEYSSGAPGHGLVSVCLCALVTLPLTTSAVWMSSESSSNHLQRQGSK